eukprot:Rmarinus@m.1304
MCGLIAPPITPYVLAVSCVLRLGIDNTYFHIIYPECSENPPWYILWYQNIINGCRRENEDQLLEFLLKETSQPDSATTTDFEVFHKRLAMHIGFKSSTDLLNDVIRCLHNIQSPDALLDFLLELKNLLNTYSVSSLGVETHSPLGIFLRKITCAAELLLFDGVIRAYEELQACLMSLSKPQSNDSCGQLGRPSDRRAVEVFLRSLGQNCETALDRHHMSTVCATSVIRDALANEVPQAFYLKYLEARARREYDDAREMLHRYFDLSAHAQHAALNVAALCYHFGEFRDALLSLHECVRACQEHGDRETLALALAWLPRIHASLTSRSSLFSLRTHTSAHARHTHPAARENGVRIANGSTERSNMRNVQASPSRSIFSRNSLSSPATNVLGTGEGSTLLSTLHSPYVYEETSKNRESEGSHILVSDILISSQEQSLACKMSETIGESFPTISEIRLKTPSIEPVVAPVARVLDMSAGSRAALAPIAPTMLSHSPVLAGTGSINIERILLRCVARRAREVGLTHMHALTLNVLAKHEAHHGVRSFPRSQGLQTTASLTTSTYVRKTRAFRYTDAATDAAVSDLNSFLPDQVAASFFTRAHLHTQFGDTRLGLIELLVALRFHAPTAALQDTARAICDAALATATMKSPEDGLHVLRTSDEVLCLDDSDSWCPIACDLLLRRECLTSPFSPHADVLQRSVLASAFAQARPAYHVRAIHAIAERYAREKRWDAAADYAGVAVTFASRAELPVEKLPSLLLLAEALLETGQIIESLRWALQARDWATSFSDSRAKVRAVSILGRIKRKFGLWEGVCEDLGKVLPAVLASRDAVCSSKVLVDLGWCLLEKSLQAKPRVKLELLAETDRYARTAVEESRKAGDTRIEADAHRLLAMSAHASGDRLRRNKAATAYRELCARC